MVSMITLAVFLFFGLSPAAPREHPVVETPLGKIRGYTMKARSGRNFFAFSGIPYALPPVGKLRFQPPEPVDPWEGELRAYDEPPLCLQALMKLPMKSVHGQEDCLYLSVYTANTSWSAPVLFHIHGGAFVFGAGKYYGPHFLMDEDLVIVNINYRLGILGFLSFENSEMPGNQGLKDQLLALKWVQKNIASFGGDPNQVTIIGESAGGASVYHHIVSPLSRGLFQRGIAESGSSYANWALSPPGFASANARKLMKLLKCPENMEEALRCVMRKDARRIVSKIRKFSEWETDPMLTFGPVLEEPGPDAFLVGPPSKWDHNPVPLLTGITSAEGLMRTLMLLRDGVDFKWFSENFHRLAPISLLYFASASNVDEVTKKIRHFYLPKDEITMNDWVNLTTMYTDCWFTKPVMDGANKHKGNVYFYYFDYPWEGTTFFPANQSLVFGSSHVDEMKFIWDLAIPFMTGIEGEELEGLSKRMVKIVSTFATSGSPIVDGIDLEWRKWSPEDHYYIHVNKEGFSLKKGLAEDRYNFWTSLNYQDKIEYEYDYGEFTLKPPSNTSTSSTGFKPEPSNSTESVSVSSSNSTAPSNSSTPLSEQAATSTTGVKEETTSESSSTSTNKPTRRCGAGFYRDDAGRCRRLRRPINKLSGLLQQAKNRISGK